MVVREATSYDRMEDVPDADEASRKRKKKLNFTSVVQEGMGIGR